MILIDFTMSINQYNERGKRHGYWETISPTGHVSFRGEYVDGHPIGLHQSFFKGKVWTESYYLTPMMYLRRLYNNIGELLCVDAYINNQMYRRKLIKK